MYRPRHRLGSAVIALSLLVALLLVNQGVTFSASPPPSTAPTSPQHFVATLGYGQDDWAANVYNPHKINVYVGDTITWVNHSKLEPHTVSFGPMSVLQGLSRARVLVTPQQGGPPQLALNPMLAFPTRSATYDGTGFANSGFLRQGQRWSVTFTRPGTYRYFCLLHFPGMFGVVVVHTRPAPSHNYSVLTGYGPSTSAADAYFPEILTIHAGDTVTWRGAEFHTITLAPAATIAHLRANFIVPVPQAGGPPKLTLNPQVVLPTGGHVYNGTGMLSSGLLQPPHNTFSITFTKPGIYHYSCLIHPGMDGTIRVLA